MAVTLDGLTRPAPCASWWPRSRPTPSADRTLNRPHGRGPVGQRADAVVQPGRGRRLRATLRRDDRDLDRAGLAGRVARLDRHRQPAVGGGLCRLPPRRRVRRGLHRARQPGDRRRAVLPQRPGRDGRRAATGSPGPGTSARGPATPSTWPPASCPRWTARWWSATTGSLRCWWRSSPATRSCSPTAGTCRA